MVKDLVEGRWVVSPKSVVEPSTSITWMGKSISGESYEIQQSSVYIAQMGTMWLRLSCQDYGEKRCRRLVGKLMLEAAPSRLTLPFLQGPIAWSVWGPPFAPYTPRNVLRSLCEALVLSSRGTPNTRGMWMQLNRRQDTHGQCGAPT